MKSLWRWVSPAHQARLLVLELDPANADYLARVADKLGASQQQVAQDLLTTALADRQVAEANLARWRLLTGRQQQIAALACLNFTNRQIAARLNLSPETVKSHMRNLLNRFELHSKSELRQLLADWDFSDWV